MLIVPRRKHRPSYYFLKEKNRILLSPAAVDLGGLCIIPRREDFDKINADIIREVFKEVCIPGEHFEYLKKLIRESFNK